MMRILRFGLLVNQESSTGHAQIIRISGQKGDKKLKNVKFTKSRAGA